MNEPAASTPKSAAPWITPTVAHVVPFAAWIFLLTMLRDLTAARYAIITVAGLALFLWLRPWRHYPAPQIRNLPLALAVGVGVFVAWVGLETDWARRAIPGVQELYERWCVLPFGKLREPLKSAPYDPTVCGWPLALMRLAGSAFVIAVIEEFFWRGFAYRWAQGGDFLKVDPGRFVPWAFFLTAVVFGSEHKEWLAGIVAGLAYGWLYLRTRDLWAAAVAHVLTNLLLAIYVLATGRWQFW